jgi:hypothetical protein
MDSKPELSKEDVLYHLSIWKDWLNGPDPANNKPIEIRDAEGHESNYKIFFGTIFDVALWILNKFSMLLSIHSLSILTTIRRIKIDYMTWEPNSCSLNNAYTDLGISYLKSGNIEKSVECLQKSWKVYPCLHIPLDFGHPFRSIPATHSGAFRPPIPVHFGHLIIQYNL